MNKKPFILTLLITLMSCFYLSKTVYAQELALDYYFENSQNLDPNVPTPESVLGYQVGEWHVRPEQIVHYLQVLAEKSERVDIEVMGYSHERRPLLLLTISSPENLSNKQQIQQAHIENLNKQSDYANTPIITWMGYSVHGNEPSGSNAALLVAYYLAASQSEEILTLLKNSIILLDPSLNPDGLARHANWVNSHKGKVLNPDEAHREHNEGWPSGRTNHYWTDLNRDWLMLQHPESKARLANFHAWKPNILTDFHEMGPHSTYFFQPGIPSRKHPLTPTDNVTLTKKIANFHVSAFDQQGQLYFTEESFDDFFYGKGSTYPDINGAIGILFEQAGSNGHLHNTINGELSFPQTIKNQVTTSFSTFAASMALKEELQAYQRRFYADVEKQASNDKTAGYLIKKPKDNARINEFAAILKQHQIQFYELSKSYKQYRNDEWFYVPLKQSQYHVIKALFSEQKRFQDNTFYDVSGWTLAHAFNLEFNALDKVLDLDKYTQVWQPEKVVNEPLADEAYAIAFEWHDYLAPKLTTQLLKQGIVLRATTSDITATGDKGAVALGAGSVIIAKGLQQQSNWQDIVFKTANQLAIKLEIISSGLTPVGSDLGSRNVVPLTLPKILILGGDGVNSSEVGELWYYLDRHVGLATTIVEQQHFKRVKLSDYTHVVFASGNFNHLAEKELTALKSWVRAGGVIWGQKSGAEFLVKNDFISATVKTSATMRKAFDTNALSYADKDELRGQQRIAGAIFAAQLDLSHPLSFGFERPLLPVFKNSNFVIEAPKKPFIQIAGYTRNPLLAGFTDSRNVEQIAEQAVMIGQSVGQGRVVIMSDNPVFRNFFYGSAKLFANSLYFSHAFSAN